MKLGSFLQNLGLRPAPDPRSRIRNACRVANHPLFLEEKNVAILWSAKAGCTFAAKWFFFQRGTLEEALAYSSWIHNYRLQVYQGSEQFFAGLRSAELGKLRYVKLVRNPFSRAVSSYLHMVNTVGNQTFHAPFNDFLGRDIEEGEGVSFSEFCDFLLSIDVSACDIHYLQQAHKLETSGLVDIAHLVRLENLDSDMRALEKRFGLKPSSVATLSRSHHHTKRTESDAFVGDKAHKSNKGKMFPDFKAFYNEELIEKVSAIYRQDIDRYGYPPRP